MNVRESKISRTIALVLAAMLALCLCSCAKNTPETQPEQQYSGTTFKLGDLTIIVTGQELVVDKNKENALAVYLHVTNNGTAGRSVMGSYTVRRTQGSSGTLKVAVAYDTESNLIHTGGKRIKAGESADIALCFKLENTSDVIITFGNEELGTKETSLTFDVADMIAAAQKS